MRKIRVSILIWAATLISCNRLNPILTAKIESFGRYDLPSRVLISVQNGSDSSLLIYRPSLTQYFLWEIEIEYESGKTNKYIMRSDIPWFEGEPVEIEAHEVFDDTIVVGSNNFYGKNTKATGCNPFLHAKRVRFIYNFGGHALPTENLSSVFVPENTPLKYKTVSGIFKTNWVETKKIDWEKIKRDYGKASKITDWIDSATSQIGIPQFNCGSGL